MPKVIMLPSQEDQMLVDGGQPPENYFEQEFDTEGELECYRSAVDALDDLVEYEILSEKELEMVVSFDGDKRKISFDTPAQKKAYMIGLEQGDGWRRARLVDESDAEFEEVLALCRKSDTPSPV